MKVASSINQWGVLSLEISGESSHENTLLEMCAKRGATLTSGSESAGTEESTVTRLRVEFGYGTAENPAQIAEQKESKLT